MFERSLPWIALALLLYADGCRSKKTPPAHEAVRRPNILFVLVDDLGWAHTGAYGNDYHETPNIDRLAARGVTFTEAYAASPVCSSTRASIQSGQYPARVGITDFIPGHWRPYERLAAPTNRTQELPLDTVTLGELMKSAGYATGYFGKWHLDGFKRASRPEVQGYDESMILLRGGHFGTELLPVPEGHGPDDYLADVLTDQTIAFIDRHQEEPFFVTLSHYAVHLPLQAAASKVAKYQEKKPPTNGLHNPTYAAMVEHVDDSVGRLLDHLDRTGLSERTVIVFYSDNGGLYQSFRGGPLVSSNSPLRDEKGTLYEGGIRVPLIIAWPNVSRAGAKSAALVTSPDLFPTFAEVGGIAGGPKLTLDGRSLGPVLRGETGFAGRVLFFHYPHYHHSVPSGAVRQGRFKMIEFYDDGHVELFDLSEDVGETIDLSARMPTKSESMRGLLAEWRRSVGAEMPVPNPDFDASRRDEWGPHPDSQLVRR